MIFRVLVFIAILLAIHFGLRRILRDWSAKFLQDDKDQHERDIKERDRYDVIDLKRNDDGVFRPGDEDDGKK